MSEQHITIQRFICDRCKVAVDGGTSKPIAYPEGWQRIELSYVYGHVCDSCCASFYEWWGGKPGEE